MQFQKNEEVLTDNSSVFNVAGIDDARENEIVFAASDEASADRLLDLLNGSVVVAVQVKKL
ncbi:hypothetical protein [Burkholderia sp. Ac-20365]|uniref:hypothetical protein n=1 Tax=Burkholderia sp. Ac-20365 TaxID=2703897 RepID=UPI00197BC8F7|nr:hypothetical protein [Burkholderia sp. Ac-20365]MBN3760896.1 hypothetical protein [Burkholderia sp. Ac-20365]